MNTRIMKKKFNKWETDRVYNITISFDDVPFVFEAFIASKKTNFQKFATSKNVMRAVKSYCKKNVWHTGACDNVGNMYHYMCKEIHADREYHKRIVEQIREEDVRNATADWEQQERTQQQFINLYDNINS